MIKYEELTLISILLTFISLLAGFVLWYVIDIFKQASKLGKDIELCNRRINRLNTSYLEGQASQQKHLFNLLTHQESNGERLEKLQRAVASSSLLVENGGKDIARLISSQHEIKHKFDDVEKINRLKLDIIRKHQTEIKKITDELILIRNKK